MQTKNTNLLSKNSRKKAFTLVELIIVITILAILATIAFISFQGYSGNARDGNKLTTLSSIEKGLSLYQIKTGNYPNPDNIYGSGTYSGTLLSQVGYVGSGVIQAINMNKVPKDPIVDFAYTYGLSNDKRYYQLGAVLENNETSLVPQTYANNYTSKVVGNYKGLYKFKTLDNTSYIVNLPSLIFTQTGEINLQTATNLNFVINNGGNLVKPYDKENNETVTATLLKLTNTGVSLTGVVIPSTEDWNTQSGSLKDTLGYEIDEIWNEATGNTPTSPNTSTPSTPVVYASCDLNGTTIPHGTTITRYETTSVTFGNTCNAEQRSCDNGILSGSFINETCSVAGATGSFTLSSTSTQAGQPITITDNCSTAPTSYTSSNTNVGVVSGTLVLAVNPGTTIITPVGGACSDTEGKALTVTAPVSQWRDISGSYCDNDDYVFTQGGVTYRWAGCNSVFGTGSERGKKADGTDGTLGSCFFNYNASSNTPTNCPIALSGNAMYSTTKEKNWVYASSVTGTVNNIWGKLYTFAEAKSGACPSGWKLPSIADFTALETKLNGGIGCIGNSCPDLGWLNNTLRNSDNNIVQALKIPLAGHGYADGTFHYRGIHAYIWSSDTESTSHSRTRTLNALANTFSAGSSNKEMFQTVRCIKE